MPSTSHSGLPATALLALGATGLALGLWLPSRTASAPQPLQPAAWTAACSPPTRPMARLELLFGATKADGSIVSETEWQAFVDSEVTPRFPAGLTVLTGYGQWRDSRGRIARETSRMLLVWHVPGPSTQGDIAAIRSAYRSRFAQDSVMRIDGAGCVDF